MRILHAAESGSRAWGFASPDSDYDVRFIYVRGMNFYLKLEKTRDVIERPLKGDLDINGWDLQKALRLLHRSNPTLFEWANSPIAYRTTEQWLHISSCFPEYFLSKSGLCHYLHMAEGNFRGYLRRDVVRIKKYLYVLRPLLACKWILKRRTSPPVLFSELVAAEAEPELKTEIEKLLDIKVNSPETDEMPQITPLNEYIEKNLPLLQAQTESLPDEVANSYEKLNRLFLDVVSS